MCTVTYIPNSDGGFIMTQNRDVRPTRFATELVNTQHGGIDFIYPKDPIAGGTWVSASSIDRVFCVMNGAHHPHAMGGTYRTSRGLIALELHKHTHARFFFEQIDLNEIEPFTMMVYDQGELIEFRWNGKEKFLTEKDTSTRHIWASSTLYDAHWQGRRQFWFNQWSREYPNPTMEEILTFHRLAGDGDPENDLVMNRRNEVGTVSITAVEKTPTSIQIYLRGLASGLDLSGEIQL